MLRCLWRRWVWAVLTGVAVAATAVADNPGRSGPPPRSAPAGPGSGATDGSRPDDTIVLKFAGQPERKVKVLKTTRQPDGTVATEVKDPATGETFTLIDGPADATRPTEKAPARPADKPAAKPAEKPSAKLSEWPTARPAEKAVPASAKDTASAAAGEGRKGLFGGRSNAPAMEKPADPQPDRSARNSPPPADTPRKPGLFSRIFGGKKSNPSGQSGSPTSSRGGSQPDAPPAPQFMPPMTGEPPRTMPSRSMPPQAMPSRPSLVPPGAALPGTALPGPARAEPVAPPTPVVPPPTQFPGAGGLPPIPSQMPSAPPRPAPPPPASTPVPAPPAPSIPAPLPSPMPTAPAVPTIPAPPGGLTPPPVPAAPPGGPPQVLAPKGGGPIQVVLPVGYVPPSILMHRDIQPYARTLTEALAPSERMLAARGLADGRHGSTDAVKAVLFKAAQTDPCPAVKACCIEQLCKLGYYDPAFLAHLKASCDDPDETVRTAARTALYKMTPRK